jgi:hypothetical protein
MADDFADVPAAARELVKRSAVMAMAAKDARLKKRTLTNLSNDRPEWLKIAHEKLDRAVIGAYALVDPEGEWEEDWAEGMQGAMTEKRKEVEGNVLGNLLRMNGERAEN